MTPADRAAARVREHAGPELVERLAWLDATRGTTPRDDDPPAAPPAGTRADYDVVLAGGGLSLLMAPVLADRGLRVAVFDRARVGAVHREWNASARELTALVDAGLFTPAEVDALVLARYRHGVCRWHGGGSHPVTRVLDHAVDAGALLDAVRARAVQRRVAVFDGHTLRGHATGRDGIALRFHTADGAVRDVVARALVDARGAASPYATADLVCPTVGGVFTGLAQGTTDDTVQRDVGDILVTTEGVEDGRQHVWEGFPGRGGETTVYLFYYDRAARVGGGSLVQLYARFFDTLGRYKRGAAVMVRPTFGYIPGWSRLTPPPAPPPGRVVLVGDAAARHSPLTYCGFGAMLRSFAPASRTVARWVTEGWPADGTGSVVHDTPLHAGTGALAHMIASPAAGADHAGDLNALLDAAFATLHAMGDEAYGALLRDEMPAGDFVRFLRATAARRPEVYRRVFQVLGATGVTRWAVGIAGAWRGSPPR